MKTTKDLSILTILAICLCLVFELSTYFLNFVFFLSYLIILLFMPRLSIGKQTLIRNILIFVLGAWLVIWLNEIMSPSFVLVFSFPLLFPHIIGQAIASWELILLCFVPSFCLLVIFAYFTKGFKGTLFFLGASVVSILYAGWTLIQVAWLYYANVGWALPDINIEGYSFPAIYIFKLFRSLFLAASFTLLGHLSNIGILGKIVDEFRRKKEKRLTDFESHSEEASVKEVLNLHKDKGQIEGSKMSEKNGVSRNVVIVFIVVILLVWITYYFIGSPSFNKSNAVSIYGTIIQGMSALMSVALAVVIFRIQSLENRNQALEQSTLNYIFQAMENIYPKWSSIVEKDIESKYLSDYYYSKICLRNPNMKRDVLKKDRDNQQERLEETVNLHTRTDGIIRQTKNRIMITLGLLISPILISFLLLMISDAFASWVTFYSVSFVILLCAFGVVFLMLTVLDSLP